MPQIAIENRTAVLEKSEITVIKIFLLFESLLYKLLRHIYQLRWQSFKNNKE